MNAVGAFVTNNNNITSHVISMQTSQIRSISQRNDLLSNAINFSRYVIQVKSERKLILSIWKDLRSPGVIVQFRIFDSFMEQVHGEYKYTSIESILIK